MKFYEKIKEEIKNDFKDDWHWRRCRPWGWGPPPFVRPPGFPFDVDAPPEIRRLFDEWLGQIEDEMLDYTNKAKSIDTEDIAKHFKLSKESVVYILTRLAKKGKVNFKKEDTK